jgi:hypothetical protein
MFMSRVRFTPFGPGTSLRVAHRHLPVSLSSAMTETAHQRRFEPSGQNGRDAPFADIAVQQGRGRWRHQERI